MKSTSRLDSAIFQLTPTRTRCDLLVSKNGKTEKVASGLLNPFLAHLKTARDQIAKGGYSVLLEPDPGSDRSWFTKGTVERFVRFVSTPEILERVYTIESEILQIEDAIAVQNGNNTSLTTAQEEYGAKKMERMEVSKPVVDGNEEKAIVLYKLDTSPPETNGSVAREGNSKVQLLKVLETRKTVLQKEQGMAFARAVAAGFDIDQMPLLVSFAESFGASRLLNACSRFVDLWKSKHESGQWLEIEATEVISNQSEYSAMNASGVMLFSVADKQKGIQNDEAFTDKNTSLDANAVSASADGRHPMSHQVPINQQEYFQGQFPQAVFPSWPVHSPPGAPPVFVPYPVQGMMPYYQNYPANMPFYQQLYPQVEDSQFNAGHRAGQRRRSMDSKGSKSESDTDTELEAEVSQSRVSRKKTGRSGKKHSGVVVIRNINYVAPKEAHSMGQESQSETDCEEGGLQTSDPNTMHKHSLPSNGKGYRGESFDEAESVFKENNIAGVETAGHWEAFQSCLLRRTDEQNHAADQAMFQLEAREGKRYATGDDSLAVVGQNQVGVHQNPAQWDKFGGNGTRMLRTSNDEVLLTRGDQLNTSSSVDPLAINAFSSCDSKRNSQQDMNDESFIIPFRSMSVDQVGPDYRTAMDVNSDLPSNFKEPRSSAERTGDQFNYEPDGLTLMPDRQLDERTLGYGSALDYEMHLCVEDVSLLDKRSKEDSADVKQGSKNPAKGQKTKVTADKKTAGPIRKAKPSKMSPLENAQIRAEKLRSYKADLQKLKKEKEKEDLKRLEDLKMERQKRIAARGNTTAAPSPSSLQTRKQLQAKVTPSSHGGSKFNDLKPGSSSPLQRSKAKPASIGSTESQIICKVNPSKGNHLPGNRLTKSVSSLHEDKKENIGIAPDSKASMERIRRLSAPKVVSSPYVPPAKTHSPASVSRKPKVSSEPESKKISAIIDLDRIKAASLPELKIKTSKGPLDLGHKKPKEITYEVNGVSCSVTSSNTETNRNSDKHIDHSDVDDNPVIDKTVVMLGCEKLSVPVGPPSEVSMRVCNDRALASPMDGVHTETTQSLSEKQPRSYEVPTYHVAKGPANLSSLTTAKNLYQASNTYATIEDPGSENSDFGKTPSVLLTRATESAETFSQHISGFNNRQLDKIPEVPEKTPVKESAKGFKRFLKFGKKNSSSATSELNTELDNASVTGSEVDDSATNGASSSEVHTLKKLISQDETPTSGTTQKASRHFSLLLPFRSKTSEKKLTL